MTPYTNTHEQDKPGRPGGMQVVVAPFSVSIGHSLELSALALLAVGLQLAYRHRGREVPLAEEHFYPGIPLSEWMEAIR
jgi:hypothetical protein